ncbi:hypothetical protein VHEMI03210 [[Torrubiella] hemipterigena]|uniref:Zn(2)-C6 fungal-type domain-containing protein n=1 Tax=[Torrubiella] hemipterigena TaxID=1531966 RepID=A0A0A1TCV0_9HYPO|nr:hypothetical protein VHEMI03210 [[Torrubiella] hemipterigena]
MADTTSPTVYVKAPKTATKTRRSTLRTRTGCMTCRKRRIRCDETRPACLKCVAARWECDGYPTTAPPQPLLHITSYAIPFQVVGSQKDRQMLHYFCVQGSHDIAGFVGADFWTKTVLRESRDNRIIRAALVALSSLQLEYTTTSPTSGYATRARAYAATPETIIQYERAVRLLRKRLTSPASNTSMVKTAIICSVLFCAFETALGQSHTAALHINNGLQMAASYRDSLTVSSIHSDDDLLNLVMILVTG